MANSPSADIKPWLQNPKWSTGTITDESGKLATKYWLFAAFATAFALFICYTDLTLPPHYRPDLLHQLFLAIPIVLALYLLARAIHISIVRKKFGVSQLQLQTLPGAIGGQLVGTILTAHPLPLTADLQLTLACVEHWVTGRGKTANSGEIIHWHEDQFLNRNLPTISGQTRIPVYFNIPAHTSPTHQIDKRQRIFWRLTAHCPTGGIEYLANFIVPVFAVSQKESLPDPAVDCRLPAPPDLPKTSRGISITKPAPGSLEIHIGPARHPLLALEHTLLAAVFASAPFLLYYYNASLTGSIISAAVLEPIALIIGISAWTLWLWRAHISIKNKSLDLTRHGQFIFLRNKEHLEAANIAGVKSEISLHIGSDQLYTLTLRTTDHHTVAIADALLKRESDHLATEIRTTLAIPTHRKPTPPATNS